MKGWVAALIVLLVITLIGVRIGFGIFSWGSSSGWDQGYSVGYNDGHDAGYSQGYTIGQVEGWEEGYNIGWSEGHAVPLQLFKSVKELREWLSQDDTNSMTFIPDTFDCDDFAMRLSQNAANDGYFIGLYHEKEAGHMKNFACIEGKTDVIYLIEPQHDRIELLRVD